MNEISLKYCRDEDLCYWYFLFQEYEEQNIKPQYFREKFELPERKFWNQIRLYRPPNPSPATYKRYDEFYKEFSESDMTIRLFTESKKIRMSTFDLWRRYFMFQERINQLRNDGKLIKPKSLIYQGK
jgi:hypothetical protein